MTSAPPPRPPFGPAPSLPDFTEQFLTALGAGPATPVDRDGRVWTFPWNNSSGWLATGDDFAEHGAEFELILAEEEDPTSLQDWLDAQPTLIKEWLEITEDQGFADLIFPGRVDEEIELDQVRRIGEVLSELAKAWLSRVHMIEARRSREPFRPEADPMLQPPVNAWLVFGSTSSMPSPEEIADQHSDAAQGLFGWRWTVNKATRAGDLLLFYFTTPWSSLKFVARAASDAFFERAHDVEGGYAPAQWWAYVTPLTAIPQVGFAAVSRLLEQPVMRGRSGKYCKPESIQRLRTWIEDQTADFDPTSCLPIPLGAAGLPEAETMTLAQWREIADGVLYPEKVVETHVVKPLVRLALQHHEGDYRLHPQFPVGRKRADYVLLKEGTPTCVIETKVTVHRPAGSDWQSAPDFQQAVGYARELGTRAALVDARTVYLISPDLSGIDQTIDRRSANDAALAAITTFILGE